MTGLAADPQHTLVIFLGASIFSGDKTLNNERFARSAEAMRRYFNDPARFGLPKTNELWLFDKTDHPTSAYESIEKFLIDAAQRPEANRPRDVIIYYVGHGFFGDNRDYYLAARSLKKNAPEFSYRFRALQRTVKQHARTLRKFYLIDACFSGAAAKELQGPESVTEKLISEAKQEAADDLPNSGTALLCAAPPDDVALALEADTRSMFTGALLDVLTGSEIVERLSLQQLHKRAAALISEQYKEDAIRPQIHAPEQKVGDIGTIALFPAGPPSPPILNAQKVTEPLGWRDALDPSSFDDDNTIYALVVNAPRPTAKGSMVLVEQLLLAWQDFRPRIAKSVNRYRESLGLPPIPSEREDGGFVVVDLCIEAAMESPDSLEAALRALCRCEVAVFDLTGYDPGVLFMLGIRAVARRGVTLTTIGGSYVIGGPLKVPFNLQLLNLIAHSKAQLDKGEGVRPHDLIGIKLETGFNELTDLPHYLDLPAYDSVRQLGVSSAAYKPIRYTEKVLVLCPFAKEYTERNWKLHIGLALSGKLKEYARRATPPEEARVRVERLLDVRTPRLVAQSLFEAIRLTDLCIIDWTNLRPNVMFEAGVRLATNALGAVHIIEAPASEAAPPAKHVESLMRMFEPIVYRCAVGQVPYEEMIHRFDTSLREYGEGRRGFIFDTVGKAINLRYQPVTVPLVDELVRSADILSSYDQDSEGVSPVLFHEVNPDLANAAKEAAAERRLAAWLYLSHRFSADEIVRDTRLLEHFNLLAPQVRRWARKAGRADLVLSVKTFEATVSDVNTTSGSPP